MKKFYSLLIAIVVTATAWSQTTNWTGAISTSWTTSGNWDNGVPVANTGIAVFSIGSSPSITNVPNITLGGLIVTGNTALTLSKPTAGGVNTLTIANTAAAIDFSITSGSSIALGNELNITLGAGSAGNPTTASIAGTFDLNDRTYNTSGSNVLTNVSGTIEVNAGGAVTSTAANELVMAATGTYIHAQNGGTVPTATWNAGSLLNVTGITTTALAGLDQAFSDITWNCTTQTLAGMRFNEMTAIRNLRIMSTGSGSIRIYSAGGTASVPTTGNVNNFEISGGTLNLSIAGGIGSLNIAGNFTQSGGTLSETSTGSGTINFNGTTVFSKTGGTISNLINFNVANGASVNFGTSVLNGSTGTFTLNAGGKIITSHASGLGATGSVQITRSYNSGADYEFGGASTGIFTTTPTASTVRDLTVNNTTANVNLAQALAVTRALALTDGELNTSTTNLLTMNAGATCAGSSDASFVNGPVRKLFNNAESFTFPVGVNGTGNEPVTIAGITAVGYDFTAEYKRVSATGLSNSYLAPILNVSACDHWTVDKNAGPAAGVSLTLTWDANSSCNGASFVTNPATLTIGHYNGASWDEAGTGGSNTSSSITRTGVTVFSPFTLANTAANQNPLPVMFNNVKAYQKNSGVQIDWSNLTERDLVNYVVERSGNGQNFASINQQLPRSNNNGAESYSFFDATPLAGINFYRIKVLEIGGKIVYSKILKVDIGASFGGFTLYPNPVKGGQVSVGLKAAQGQYTIKVVNTAGQEIYSQKISHQGGSMTQTVDIPSTVKAGVYNMVISGDNYRESKMFIVQ